MKKLLLIATFVGVASAAVLGLSIAADNPAQPAVSKQSDLPAKYKDFKKPGEDELRKQLTPLQYRVTQKEGTERPFSNEYWNNKKEGIYVDIVSGEPLFSSKDKFKSGTGWPSFVRPITRDALTEHVDKGLFSTRTELRSKAAESHLGHVFKDGPKPTGLRYCINSASLRFVPKQDLKNAGYEEFLAQFSQ